MPKTRLKVLCIVSIMPPYQGGAAVDYGIILERLGAGFNRDFDIRVLTERGCSKEAEGVSYDDSLLSYDSAPIKRRAHQAVNYLKILREILFSGSDVVHIHARYVYGRYIGRLIWLALLLSPSKVVIDIRDRFYGNFGFGHNFIFCSDDLREFYGWIENAIVIQVPLALKPLRSAVEPGRKLAYFGTIAANKGVLELLDAYAAYRKGSENPLELDFYGFNAMGAVFTERVSNIEGAAYQGYVPPGDVPDRIREYKAVVLPSASEGMPRVCLEALYARRMVICHESVRGSIACIPEEFTFSDAVKDLPGLFARAELPRGEVLYEYDFKRHDPRAICGELADLYRWIAPGCKRKAATT
ncbi:MAG: glycosyltransferase family 4 protein [Deltaproteobacteria bacterium]|nr:glycosyltransferase family 4 protein [Deltaproteobacteria bacterium]